MWRGSPRWAFWCELFAGREAARRTRRAAAGTEATPEDVWSPWRTSCCSSCRDAERQRGGIICNIPVRAQADWVPYSPKCWLIILTSLSQQLFLTWAQRKSFLGRSGCERSRCRQESCAERGSGLCHIYLRRLCSWRRGPPGLSGTCNTKQQSFHQSLDRTSIRKGVVGEGDSEGPWIIGGGSHVLCRLNFERA